MTIEDVRADDVTRWLALGGDYDPGALVFDYFNDRQLGDLAQSLGLNLALSRQVTRDKEGAGQLKVSLKVVEVAASDKHGSAEAATHAGSMPTAIFIEIYVRLRQELRVQVLSHPRVDGPTGMLAACRSAVSDRSWVIVEGDWTVSEAPLSLTLVRSAGAPEDLDRDELTITAAVPADHDELLPTGRVRLAPGRRILGTVFGQIDAWNEANRCLALIAHAEFMRIGDPRFQWHGRSFGVSSNGDF